MTEFTPQPPPKDSQEKSLSKLATKAAEQMIASANIQPGQKVLVVHETAEVAKMLGNALLFGSEAQGAEVSNYYLNPTTIAEKFGDPDADDEKLKEVFANLSEKVEAADQIFIVQGTEDPEAYSRLTPERQALRRNLFGQQVGSKLGEHWVLTNAPTDYEAKQERKDMSLEEYSAIVFEAYGQDWEKIKEAQQYLIDTILNPGKKLELHANEKDLDPKKQTHLYMSIEDMTFANSTVTHNYPGSEVFSAPKIDSVEGQLYAPGILLYNGVEIKNIFLVFEEGKIVHAEADENNDALQEILADGDGAKYLGEVALGTNSALKTLLRNPLLREKVAGSFHVAVGKCYPDETYDGKIVHLNNGNTAEKTKVHMDVPVDMRKNGRVVVDGKIIQINGRFVPEYPKLAYLNPLEEEAA